MSSEPPSPGAAPDSSQHQSDNNSQSITSPHKRADSGVHVDGTPEKTEPDSSFQSNSSERHPKGKRKRTAAKDKAILEAAYNANPKPDKAARLDIVKRVSLNEKEVQIWFQNRRQNDRRKSRPLSPQEIAALQYGGMQVLSSESYSTAPPASSLPNPNTSPSPSSSMPESENTSPPSTTESVPPRAHDENTTKPAEARHIRRESAASVGVLPSSRPVEFAASQPHQLYRSSSVGYFANRLHAGTSFQAGPVNRQSPDSLRHEFLQASRLSSSAPVPAPVLPPPHASKFRLSMSVEGKAELVPQPSPPRLSPPALSDDPVPSLDRPNLHRSHSAAASITLPPISTLTASLEADVAPLAPAQVLISQQPQSRLHSRLHRSRSRDVHAWELACEANSGEHRDELTAYAERESSGSAIAAISLLRTLSSNSQSSMNQTNDVLQFNSAKRTARPNTHQHHHAKRPRLSRSSSSVARLQTNFVNTSMDKPPGRRTENHADADEPKKIKMSTLLSSGGNDSDKENWSPDDEGNPVFPGAPRPTNGRRPLPSAPLSKALSTASQNTRRSTARVLEDGTNRFFLGSGVRSNTAPASRRKKGGTSIEIFEDLGEEADASDNENYRRPGREGVMDDEVERFMRGEVSPSKKGAASAVAGLLALSQGNWR